MKREQHFERMAHRCLEKSQEQLRRANKVEAQGRNYLAASFRETAMEFSTQATWYFRLAYRARNNLT
jgi:hypothetical protein